MKFLAGPFYLKIFLGPIFILITGYNFYIAESTKYESDGDAASFVGLGVSLAQHGKYGHLITEGGLINSFKGNKISEEKLHFANHSTWRPPVWPLIIAGIFLIFGYQLTYILIFKFLLHFLGIFIFYRTLKLLKLKEVLVIIGSFLYAISPAWQIYSRVFLSEPVTFFFITLWIYLLIRNVQKKSGPIPQGFVGGLLILSHPYYLFLPFTVWFILFLYRQIKFKSLLITSLLAVAVVSIWIIRNSIVLDTNSLILTTSSGAVMAKGWNKNVIAEHTNTKGDLANEGLVLEDYDFNRNKGYGEVEMLQLYKDATIHFINTHPEMVVPIVGKKLVSAFNPFPETPKPGVLETGRWMFHLLALVALIYLLIFSRNKLVLTLAIGLILSTIGITIITYSGFRFRMPQAALELLLLVYAINVKVEKLKRENKEYKFKNTMN
ncbi:ArnT family glycosyltransferase [Salinimicrobium sediminilitoris]|uniref:ArnT family glycosyltransferase n=1 Tax=Salinimicrobium sediminilitoris TaxID=2876715 RepID=UPI001E583970|nr:glycosyltransferase family 39 protein [Salinimicrobium sediminilitoris]MCC8358509.1 glycosyltransferase family 39 protein [Salinimicrobium sediminilitoris]